MVTLLQHCILWTWDTKWRVQPFPADMQRHIGLARIPNDRCLGRMLTRLFYKGHTNLLCSIYLMWDTKSLALSWVIAQCLIIMSKRLEAVYDNFVAWCIWLCAKMSKHISWTSPGLESWHFRTLLYSLLMNMLFVTLATCVCVIAY